MDRPWPTCINPMLMAMATPIFSLKFNCVFHTSGHGSRARKISALAENAAKGDPREQMLVQPCLCDTPSRPPTNATSGQRYLHVVKMPSFENVPLGQQVPSIIGFQFFCGGLHLRKVATANTVMGTLRTMPIVHSRILCHRSIIKRARVIMKDVLLQAAARMLGTEAIVEYNKKDSRFSAGISLKCRPKPTETLRLVTAIETASMIWKKQTRRH